MQLHVPIEMSLQRERLAGKAYLRERKVPQCSKTMMKPRLTLIHRELRWFHKSLLEQKRQCMESAVHGAIACTPGILQKAHAPPTHTKEPHTTLKLVLALRQSVILRHKKARNPNHKSGFIDPFKS